MASGDDQHLEAGTSIRSVFSREEGAKYMAAAYAGKLEQKTIPEGFEELGRWWSGSRGLVKAVREERIEDFHEGMKVLRGMRKFVGKSLKASKQQPEREGKKRKRSVSRKRDKFLKARLEGFTAFKGAKVVDRLLDSARVGVGIKQV